MVLNFGGVRSITNLSTLNYSMVKLEWPSVRYYIPTQANPFDAGGEAVPWAWNGVDIAGKAFLVRVNATSADDGSGFAYLFMDRDGMICQAPYRGGSPIYETRNIAFKSDGMRITLHNDRVELIDLSFAPG
jgi:hypothetical protein